MFTVLALCQKSDGERGGRSTAMIADAVLSAPTLEASLFAARRLAARRLAFPLTCRPLAISCTEGVPSTSTCSGRDVGLSEEVAKALEAATIKRCPMNCIVIPSNSESPAFPMWLR